MAQPSTPAVREALLQAQQQLISSLTIEPNEARLEAQLLLQAAAHVDRAWLISHENDALQANIHAAFQASLLRRIQGEPIAYILGYREFYGLELMVSPDTLIPRPDTETLVEAALARIAAPLFQRKLLDSDSRRNDEINEDQIRVLDLGTGTGAIALAIAKHRKNTDVIAVDASAAALEVAVNNARRLNIANVQFRTSNWFDALEHERFDVIVSNPPYIEQGDAHLNQGDLRFEPLSALASGVDGLDDIHHIIANCLIYLNPQGWLMLEHGYNQAQAVADLMAEIGLVDIATIQDLGGNNRATIGKNSLIVSTHWD